MAATARFHKDPESDISPKSGKGSMFCPTVVRGCSIKEIYHYRFGKILKQPQCSIHNVNAAQNCFVHRVADQVKYVSRFGCDVGCKNHMLPINLAASYMAAIDTSPDTVMKWYNNEFHKKGIYGHHIPPLTIYSKDKLTQILSDECKRALAAKEKDLDDHLDDQLDAWKAS